MVSSLKYYQFNVIRFLFFLLLFLAFVAETSFSQNDSRRPVTPFISISVSTTVQSVVELETLNNINFGTVTPGMQDIYINPRQDAGAGLMRISGQAGSVVRISYLEQRELTHSASGQTLLFFFELSGAETDNQDLSELVTAENRQISLSSNGEYYFWIGGRMNLNNIRFGQYEGEFTLEIDYL